MTTVNCLALRENGRAQLMPRNLNFPYPHFAGRLSVFIHAANLEEPLDCFQALCKRLLKGNDTKLSGHISCMDCHRTEHKFVLNLFKL